MKSIDSNIKKASTIPSSFYTESSFFESSKGDIFDKTWHWVGKKKEILPQGVNSYPFFLYDKFLAEPLVLIEENEDLRCLSNVCTHRAFLLCHHPAQLRNITCAYHGRRFGLDGQMQHMPEFKEAEDFPRPCDHLTSLPVKVWKDFIFTAIRPDFNFEIIANKLNERIGFLDMANYRYAPESDKIYHVNAHWALYVDNFLEGFHIPFVHDTLAGMIDYGSYVTECYDFLNLQIGFSKGDTPYFDLPEGHMDYGKKVTAYYYWIFPNLMLNVYPWGMQVNVVVPISSQSTKVYFYHYIADEDLWKTMEGEHVAEKTQREDEWVVEGVQKGLKSRFYDTGRFSPAREQGVHHFHSLIAQFMKG